MAEDGARGGARRHGRQTPGNLSLARPFHKCLGEHPGQGVAAGRNSLLVEGFGDLGYVLGDTALQREARFWIDSVLGSQREDGWFGPRELLTSLGGKADLWPHMVILNVLQSFHEATDDRRVIPFMTRYFRWQDALPAESFGAGYWPRFRMGDNIESALWLYNRTGEAWLLGLARKMHEHMARWDTAVVNWHNVNVAQGFRAPAVYYQAGCDITLLNAAERNYRKVRSEYGQFPGGGFCRG